jgi:hypothetical protein
LAGAVNPFSFVNSITYDKRDIYDDETKKHYIPFLINRALSYFPDTVLYANDMNIFNELPKYFQYSYFLNSIAKRKRFSKWGKKVGSDSLDLIMEIYQLNERKAREILSILTPDQLDSLHQMKTGNDNERRRSK